MSHFLRKSEVRERFLRREYAAVLVKITSYSPRTLEVNSFKGVFVLKDGARFSPLPGDVKVTGPEGECVIKPSGEFWVSTETFDPYHALIDLQHEDVMS